MDIFNWFSETGDPNWELSPSVARWKEAFSSDAPMVLVDDTGKVISATPQGAANLAAGLEVTVSSAPPEVLAEKKAAASKRNLLIIGAVAAMLVIYFILRKKRRRR